MVSSKKSDFLSGDVPILMPTLIRNVPLPFLLHLRGQSAEEEKEDLSKLKARGDLTGTRFPIDFWVISNGKWFPKFPIASWLQGFLGADFISFSIVFHLVWILSCHVLMLVDSVNPSLFHVFHLDVFCVAPERFIATSYLKCV